MFRKRLVTTAIAVTFSVSASADIQSEMQGWFNEMGAYGNVTGPQVIQGQTTTVYTGGSLYMRTPIRNYQLASFTPDAAASTSSRDRSPSSTRSN
jgi:conjugative transfer pilus assembly protein TraH